MTDPPPNESQPDDPNYVIISETSSSSSTVASFDSNPWIVDLTNSKMLVTSFRANNKRDTTRGVDDRAEFYFPLDTKEFVIGGPGPMTSDYQASSTTRRPRISSSDSFWGNSAPTSLVGQTEDKTSQCWSIENLSEIEKEDDRQNETWSVSSFDQIEVNIKADLTQNGSGAGLSGAVGINESSSSSSDWSKISPDKTRRSKLFDSELLGPDKLKAEFKSTHKDEIMAKSGKGFEKYRSDKKNVADEKEIMISKDHKNEKEAKRELESGKNLAQNEEKSSQVVKKKVLSRTEPEIIEYRPPENEVRAESRSETKICSYSPTLALSDLEKNEYFEDPDLHKGDKKVKKKQEAAPKTEKQMSQLISDDQADVVEVGRISKTNLDKFEKSSKIVDVDEMLEKKGQNKENRIKSRGKTSSKSSTKEPKTKQIKRSSLFQYAGHEQKKSTLKNADSVNQSKLFYQHWTNGQEKPEVKKNLKMFLSVAKKCESNFMKERRLRAAQTKPLSIVPPNVLNLTEIETHQKEISKKDSDVFKSWFICGRSDADLPVCMKKCTMTTINSMVTSNQSRVFLMKFYERLDIKLQNIIEYEFVHYARRNIFESIADRVLARYPECLDDLKRNFNTIFPLDQIPTSIIPSEHFIYAESMPPIVVGYVRSLRDNDSPIEWDSFKNTVEFYMRFDFSAFVPKEKYPVVVLVKRPRIDVTQLVDTIRENENNLNLEFISDPELEEKTSRAFAINTNSKEKFSEPVWDDNGENSSSQLDSFWSNSQPPTYDEALNYAPMSILTSMPQSPTMTDDDNRKRNKS